MTPVQFKMVDLGGIDLVEIDGTVVPGIYNKILGAYNTCRVAILCNWFFAGILLPPAHVLITMDDDVLMINDVISVESDDVLSIPSLTPSVVIEELTAIENGTYTPDIGVNGFSPVIVEVPAPEPVTVSLSVTENGTYTPPQGVDGYNPVTVSVGPPPDPSLPSEYQELEYISFTPNAGFLVTIPTSGLFEVLFEVDELVGNQECPFGYRVATTNNADFEFQIYSDTGAAEVYVRNLPYSSSPSIEEIELNTPISMKMAISGIRNAAYIARYFYTTGSSPANNYSLNGKVYYVRVTDLLTGLVIAKYVPCYRKSDNVLGYYDVVGETFYSTQYIDHGGTIVAGPIKN